MIKEDDISKHCVETVMRVIIVLIQSEINQVGI